MTRTAGNSISGGIVKERSMQRGNAFTKIGKAHRQSWRVIAAYNTPAAMLSLH